MKPLVTLLAAALLIAAACSESGTPIGIKSGLQSRFEIGVLQGRCPPPFTLLFYIKTDFEAAVADRNGDGFACYLVTHTTDYEVFRTWTDNNVPVSQIGGCPNGFFLELAPKKDPLEDNGDSNGDGYIRTRTTGGGSSIVIDNNHRNQGT